ncbi:hypothetical protein CEQ23_35665 [Burkholderia cepacia]|uniref:Pilus assembly protein n=2 Tax=Burkholderia cepacia TaxID=292 RepID=A0ABM6P7I6_BURCE|nr:hypothetical protein CEQ23_35665 [Burkholderia cepacia]ATF83080.1 hypothetical protein CO711_38630 [Burkholderia cepacia]QCY08084.1 hypothetical protein EJ998_33110 [Burkholderia cepacia ATCC 25416]
MIAGFISGSAFAAIDVMPKEIEVDKGTTSVQIVNNGDRPEYVTISLARLLNPGVPLKEEELEQVGTAVKPSLYAYPFKLTLAPRQTKTIKLKPTQPVETETVYRLDVKPVIRVLAEERQKASGSIVVSLGFSALVRQLPANEREELSVTCDAYGARLTATGNVRYAVKDAKVDGHAVEKFNVYPGVPRPLQGHIVEIPGQPTCRSSSASSDTKTTGSDGL